MGEGGFIYFRLSFGANVEGKIVKAKSVIEDKRLKLKKNYERGNCWQMKCSYVMARWVQIPSVVDPDTFDTDPDPAFQFDTDPDLTV